MLLLVHPLGRMLAEVRHGVGSGVRKALER